LARFRLKVLLHSWSLPRLPPLHIPITAYATMAIGPVKMPRPVVLGAFAAFLLGLVLLWAGSSGQRVRHAAAAVQVFVPADGSEAADVRRLTTVTNKGGFQGFLLNNLPAIIFGVIFNLTFALVYKLKVVDKSPKLQQMLPSGETEFQPGLNDCLRERHLCLHIFFFCPCRVAHTWHVAGLLSYWPAIFVQACCGVCVGAHFRASLKKKMGIQPDALTECKTILCSQCCAVGQEAMALDSELGVKTQCCCHLEQLEPKQVRMASNAPGPTMLTGQGAISENKPTVSQV